MDVKGKNLLILGDSIMFGSGNEGYGVGEYLERDLGVKLFKYCVGGARVGYDEGKSWVVEQVRSAISDGVKPDIIVFDGFTNDCNMTDGVNCDVPLGEKTHNVKNLYEITKTDSFTVCFVGVVCALNQYFPQAKKLFIRPHKMGRRGAEVQIEYGERAVEICNGYGVAVCDLYKDSE